MFLLRSAFWLLLAFVLIRPGVDLTGPANAMSSQALTEGQQFIARQITQAECANIECVGGKAVLTAMLPKFPPTGAPMQVLPAIEDSVPLPRPRPNHAG